MTVRLPGGVRGMARRGPGWAAWVHGLPAVAGALLEEWRLTLTDIAQHGNCALVLPVRTDDGQPAVLKISFPDEESSQEHVALQRWHGDGAVHLLRADPHRRALLLERLESRTLTDLGDLEACEVVASLYSRLHVPAPPRLRLLSREVERWVERLAALPRSAPVPRRLVEQSLSLARVFAGDPATDGRLVHGDLHYLNVLASTREPWLAIDPKPLSGDPHFEPAPMLWNRWDEVLGSGDARDAVRRRFHTLVDVAGLDEDRARDWVVLRETVNAVEALDAPQPDQDWVTVSISVAKAVQD